MKRIISIFIILALLLGAATLVFAENDLKSKEEVAEQALKRMISEMENREMILDQELRDFGLASLEELRRLTVGTGYEMYFLDPDKIELYEGDKLSEIIKPANAREHTLYLDGTPKLSMTIYFYENGEFDIGYGGGGDELDIAVTQYKGFLKDLNEKYVEPILVIDEPRHCMHLLAITKTRELALSTKLKYYPQNTLFESKILVNAYKEISKQPPIEEGRLGGSSFDLEKYLKNELAVSDTVSKAKGNFNGRYIIYALTALFIIAAIAGVSAIVYRRNSLLNSK